MQKENGKSNLFVLQRYSFSSEPEQSVEVEIPTNEYLFYVNETLEYLSDSFWKLEDVLEDDEFDVELSDGVLKVNLGKYGSYVLNKQTPNKQLWFSSPVSGPKRYRWCTEKKKWINTRDDHCLMEILNKELTQLINCDMKLSPPSLHYS